MKNLFNYILLFAILLLVIAGCGGGSDDNNINEDPEVVLNGQFIDSAVSGLYFEATPSGRSGMTDASGTFNYEAGDTVQFYIGDLLIGEAPATDVITPVSLVSGAVDETNAIVRNIARLLLTLDSNDNPDDGITIPTAVFSAASGKTLDFSDTAGFDAAATSFLNEIFTIVGTAAPVLVTNAVAEQHLRSTLLSMVVGGYSGTWVQTMGQGSDDGIWMFTVNSAGELDGCGSSNVFANDDFLMSGTVSSSGSTQASSGTTDTGAAFTGSVVADGNITGTWSNSTFGTSGTFTGSRTTDTISCPSPPLGTMSVTGADVGGGGVGSSIILVWEAAVILSPYPDIHVTWKDWDGLPIPDLIHQIEIQFNNTTGELISVNLRAINNGANYLYDCLADACAGIGITADPSTKEVTFSNASLQVKDIVFNQATAPITLNGTIIYN